MRRKGKAPVGLGPSKARTKSAGKTLRRCTNNGKSDNIFLIDVDNDSDSIDNIIIVDVPESLKQKLRGSSVLKRHRRSQIPTIICIDEDDECSDKNQPATSVGEGVHCCSDPPSGPRSSPSSDPILNSSDKFSDECQHPENLTPMKLSSKRTYCGKASSRNCYGLGPDSSDEKSDNNQNDDEFMEGTFEELRELWEKANRIKKYGFVKDDKPPAASTRCTVGVKKEKENDRHSKDQIHLNASNVGCEKRTTSPVCKDAPIFGAKHSVDTEFGNGTPSTSSHFRNDGSNPKENKLSGEPIYHSSQSTSGTQVNDKFVDDPDSKAAPRKSASKDSPTCEINHNIAANEAISKEDADKESPLGTSDLRPKKDHCQGKDEAVLQESFSGGPLPRNESQPKRAGESSFGTKPQTGNSLDEVVNEGHNHKTQIPSQSSKCGKSHFRKASSRNCHGLVPDSGRDKSENSQTDDEIMEGTFGELRELWEKANRIKKHGLVKDDKPTAPKTRQNVGGKKGNKNDPHLKTRVHLNSSSVDYEKATPSHLCEETSFFRPKHSVDTKVGDDKPSCSSHFHDELKNHGTKSVSEENEAYGESIYQSREPTGETQVNDDFVGNYGYSLPRKYAVNDPPTFEAQVNDGIADNEAVPEENMDRYPPREPSGTRSRKVPCQDEDDTMPHNQQTEDKEHNEDAGDMITDSLIICREKLKETDEYKKAEEEEWASRQQALQLQAQEAQRARQLRKRQKAESLRLLDMERRQKQRVEEIRESQKKDEENMNMKEKVRAEVRKELLLLEAKSQDMASLLRGLGVNVSGGLHPLPQEIRAAYKRALLSFHPDRAPGSDIRLLVEAEEKFKLISRMKEKFLPPS